MWYLVDMSFVCCQKYILFFGYGMFFQYCDAEMILHIHTCPFLLHILLLPDSLIFKNITYVCLLVRFGWPFQWLVHVIFQSAFRAKLARRSIPHLRVACQMGNQAKRQFHFNGRKHCTHTILQRNWKDLGI